MTHWRKVPRRAPFNKRRHGSPRIAASRQVARRGVSFEALPDLVVRELYERVVLLRELVAQDAVVLGADLAVSLPQWRFRK